VFGLLRLVVYAVILVVFVYLGTTVKLGSRTLFGHISRVWKADETQELVHGVKEKSGPALERVRRGVKAGIKEAQRGPDGKPVKEPQEEPPGAADPAEK
jgi:hypothetical protein